MSSKTLIILGAIFILVILVGSYFLVGSSSKSASQQIVSYKTSDKEKPKLEARTTFADLGNMKVSQQKGAIFTIKNIGQKPLQLFEISSSCMCTVGQVIIDGKESEEFDMHSQSDYIGDIMPKKEGKVKVIYRPYVMPVYGPVDREVYVTTNDPENQKLVFKIKAIVN